MARIDTLTNFLTDVADSIRSKTGKSEAIACEDFDTEIESISGGGGSANVENDVTFLDYDGTIVDSYTKNQFLALTEMPENPTHEGLTAQGWNWALNDAKEYVNDYGGLYIGQSYITDDGRTRIYLTLPEYQLDISVRFIVPNSGTIIEIDWGDDTTPYTETTVESNKGLNIKHTYQNAGDYVISISNNKEIKIYANSSNDGSMIINDTTSTTAKKSYLCIITSIELGLNVSFGAHPFSQLTSLKTITIPTNITMTYSLMFNYCKNLKTVILPLGIRKNSVASFNGNEFANCLNLKYVSIPKSFANVTSYMFNYCKKISKIYLSSETTSIGDYAFNESTIQDVIIPSSITVLSAYMFQNTNIERITMPSSVTSLNNSTFRGCSALTEIELSPNITSIPTYCFYDNKSLKKIILQDSITSIGSYSFSACPSLVYLKMPANLTSIQTRAFYQNNGMKIYDFSNALSIPSLPKTDAFTGIPSDCKIIVPDSLYDDWIAMSGWSTYASYIIKVSEA